MLCADQIFLVGVFQVIWSEIHSTFSLHGLPFLLIGFGHLTPNKNYSDSRYFQILPFCALMVVLFILPCVRFFFFWVGGGGGGCCTWDKGLTPCSLGWGWQRAYRRVIATPYFVPNCALGSKQEKKGVNEAAHASLYKLTSRFWIVAAHLLGWSLQNYY